MFKSMNFGTKFCLCNKFERLVWAIQLYLCGADFLISCSHLRVKLEPYENVLEIGGIDLAITPYTRANTFYVPVHARHEIFYADNN